MKFSFLGSLVDTHIWDLAQRVTNEEEFLRLGRGVLQLPDHEVRSALTEYKHALAARQLLEHWAKNQYSPEEAYNSLYRALSNYGWRQLAGVLSQWDYEGKKNFLLLIFVVYPDSPHT